VDGTKLKYFYHGIDSANNPFDSCLLSLNCPVSVTTTLNVQTLYTCADGIILQMQMNENYADRSLRYFDCSLFSNRSFENERLFVNAPSDCYLRIHSVLDMQSNEDYALYIHAIAKMDEMLNGVNVSMTKWDMQILTELCFQMDEAIFPNILTNFLHDIPKYIVHSFVQWTQRKRNKIIIDIRHLNEGYKAMAAVFVDDSQSIANLLAFDRIVCIFKSVQEIECREIGDICSQYVPSFVSALERVNAIGHSRLNKIYLSGCDNVYLFYTNFCKFQSALGKQHWKIERDENTLIISKCI